MDFIEPGKELIDIVEKTGKAIRQATRNEVYKKGLLHPAVFLPGDLMS